MIETAVVAGRSVWLLVEAGAPAQPTVGVALVLLFAADRVFRFQAVLPIMTPVLLIGGMTTGIFTPTEAPSPPACGRWSWAWRGTAR